jgi:hypothetical protein
VSYVLGVDAYKSGWVALALGNGTVSGCQLYGHISELIDDHSAAGIIAVDIPIGLPEKGPRQADVEARRFVGPRRSSVFPTPPRAILEAPTYDEAIVLAQALGGLASHGRVSPWRRRFWRWMLLPLRTNGSSRFIPRCLSERWLTARSTFPRSRGTGSCLGASFLKQTGSCFPMTFPREGWLRPMIPRRSGQRHGRPTASHREGQGLSVIPRRSILADGRSLSGTDRAPS